MRKDKQSLNPNWVPGIPTNPGLYWFDPGLNKIDHAKGLMVAQVGKGIIYLFGTYGSFPIDKYNIDIFEKYSKHLPIKFPHTTDTRDECWQHYSSLEKVSRAWVKENNSLNLGFALISPKNFATILWIGGICASETGAFIEDEKYLIYPVEEPKI